MEPITYEAIYYWSFCKEVFKNQLPRAGGIEDQDAKLMQAFEIIHSEKVKFEEKKIKAGRENFGKNRDVMIC